MNDFLTLLYIFGVSLGVTLAVEVAAAGIRRFSRRDLLLCLLLNLLTNPLAVYLNLMLTTLLPGVLPLWQIPIEAAVIVAEGVCYARFSGLRHPWRFAVVVNLISYGIGLLLNAVILIVKINMMLRGGSL